MSNEKPHVVTSLPADAPRAADETTPEDETTLRHRLWTRLTNPKVKLFTGGVAAGLATAGGIVYLANRVDEDEHDGNGNPLDIPTT